MWNNAGITCEICVRMAFPINYVWEQELNIIHIVGIPCQDFATQRIWDERADSDTGKYITISAGVAASVLLCNHFESSLTLLLIVNDFFKCKLVSLTLSLRRCHIPRCKSKVNPQIRFPLAGCLDIVRTGERARSVLSTMQTWTTDNLSSKWLWSCSSESFTSEMESMRNTRGYEQWEG